MEDKIWWQNCITVGGFDIGKKSNPSHCSIFAVTENAEHEENLIQIHQKFLDGWDYIKQVSYIEMCVEYFSIPRMYIDNTRGEFEDRSVPRQCMLIVLSSGDGHKSKNKMKMAINLAKMVEQKRIRLLDDDRFISQITCVRNDLSASSTPMGHGDAFISVMLAVAVYEDFYAKNRRSGFTSLGNLQEWTRDRRIPEPSKDWKTIPVTTFIKDDYVCKICNKRALEKLDDGRVRCGVCFAVY